MSHVLPKLSHPQLQYSIYVFLCLDFYTYLLIEMGFYYFTDHQFHYWICTSGRVENVNYRNL